MKKAIFLCAFCASVTIAFAQTETYDLTAYTPPKARLSDGQVWKKEVKANTYTSYTITNQQKKDYCQIFIMLSTGSKGGIKEDFDNEWQNLIANQYNVTDAPRITNPITAGDWNIQRGMATFTFNNEKSTAMLTTMSAYNKAVSIVVLTNSEDYIPAIQSFLESIEMKKPSVDNALEQKTTQSTNQPAQNNQFAFTSTNFDDGWTSKVQEDWVQATKGNIRVLIHYPNKKADKYNSVLMDGLKNAWNILVAPKYSSGTNFEFKPQSGWEPIEFAKADMIEKGSGKSVHVVLFKKNYSNGSGKYLEFITPNKNSFEQEFGAYDNSTGGFGIGSGWDKMANLASYNKFAVAASDLQGKWTNDFSGAIQYVNAYTGFDAGMATHASVENFQIGPDNTYKWDLGVASGQVGNIKFQSRNSGGKFSMTDNWKVNFSDIEGKPRSYNVYFSCIKGLRILWLDDRAFAKAQ